MRWRLLLPILLTCLAAHRAPAAEWQVEFRDGSRVALDLAEAELLLKPAGNDPVDAQRRVLLSEISEMRIAKYPPLERVKRIGEALRALHSDDFAAREHAVRNLRELGGGFRELLQQRLQAAPDPEIRWRLRRVLGGLSSTGGGNFDHVLVDGAALRGELAPWEIRCRYRGAELRLDRHTVRTIRAADQGRERGTGARPLIVRDDRPGLLPAGARRVGFDRDPQGRALEVGDDIGLRFTDWGVKLSTSIRSSYVSVNKHEIAGAGGGLTAATHDPLFEGTITLEFCRPGEPGIPAGVHFVGCWLAIVSPAGTALVAYDAAGEEIARAEVERGPAEFLAIRSEVPIARAEIVPNVEIDSNFTLDDLVFDRPSPLDDAPHPKHFSLLLRDGARLNCRAFTTSPDGREFLATPDAGFATQIRIPYGDVASLLTPSRLARTGAPMGTSLWALFYDGSCLRADPGAPPNTLLGKLPLEKGKLAAIWNSKVELRRPEDALQIPDGGAAMLLRDEPIYLEKVELRDQELAGIREDSSTVLYNYSRLPSIWFTSSPPVRDARHGEIRLSTGERLALGPGAHFALQAIPGSGEGLSIRSASDEVFELDLWMIRRVLFPGEAGPP